MLRLGKLGGSFYFLRVGLAATIIIAGAWVLFFANWSNWFNQASISFLQQTKLQPQFEVVTTAAVFPEGNTAKTLPLLPILEKLLIPTTPGEKILVTEETVEVVETEAVTPVVTTEKITTKADIPVKLPLCPESPPKLVGPLAVNFEQPSFEVIAAAHPLLKPGGYYRPPDCTPRNGPTAIIIPYRNREAHLRGFLHHMHPILQRQLLEYVIIVVDQAGDNRFNRALLMNIGYKESLKILPNGTQFQCYIFHDVDLLPEDDRGIYTCSDKSIHLSGYIDKFDYKIPYGAIFGGASAIPRKHFELINGFSDVFFGWGGEDDDIHDRLIHLKLPIMRYEKEVLRYKMYKHEHEKTNAANDNRMALLRKTVQRMHHDGINSLSYKLIKRDDFPTYTHLLVEFTEEEIYQAVFGTPTVQL